MNTSNKLNTTKETLQGMQHMLKMTKQRGFLTHNASTKAKLLGLRNIARYRFSPASNLETAYQIAPNTTAIIDDDTQLTYAQLRHNARSLAQWLTNYAQQHNLKPHQLNYGILARNSSGAATAILARSYNGAIANMLNIQGSPEQINNLIQQNNIKLIITDPEFLPKIPHNTDKIIINDTTTTPNPNHITLNHITQTTQKIKLPLIPKQTPYILYSSGTTGTPKGIQRKEPTFPVTLGAILDNLDWHANQTIYIPCTLFHTWGIGALNIAIAGTCTMIMSRHFDPDKGMQIIQKYKCDGAVTSPIFYKNMLDKKYDMSSLKWIGSGGNKVTPQLVHDVNQHFGRPILTTIYGSTEADLVACANPQQLANDPTTVGTPVTGVQVTIRDPQGNPLPQGKTGQITIKSPMMLTGYTNPNKKPPYTQDGMLQMGDTGYIDNNNQLHVLGRSDSMIIVGGENVHPESVTATIESMPEIAEAACIGVEDKDTFQRIAAYVVTHKPHTLTPKQIQQHVAQNLADHSIPRDVHFIDKLPRNIMGKIQINQLTKLHNHPH